jgi:hypothetical protein
MDVLRKWWQSIISTYRESLLPLLRMPAAWILLGVWLTGCSILAFSGYSSDVLGNLPVWTIILLLTLLTIPLTAGMPAPQRKAAPSHITKTRWGIQVATLLVVFLFISSLTLIHYKVVEVAVIDRFGGSWLLLAVVLQAVYMALGLVIFGLSTFLWMAEFRGQHFAARQASHS